MSVKIENYTYGKQWDKLFVDKCDSDGTCMNDFHAHDYYEMSLILSGRVRVIAGSVSSDSSEPRLMLCPPRTPHFVSSESKTRYRRINLIFAESFIEDPEDLAIVREAFGITDAQTKREGRVLPLDVVSIEQLSTVLDLLGNELRYLSLTERDEDEIEKRPTDHQGNTSYRRSQSREALLAESRAKHLIVYLAALITSLGEHPIEERMPDFVREALSFITEHYGERLTAASIARRVGVGRTTLMLAFKASTGSTVGDYLTKCRLLAAVRALSDGATEYAAAEQCGFADASALIRAFKRHFGTTPRAYLRPRHN